MRRISRWKTATVLVVSLVIAVSAGYVIVVGCALGDFGSFGGGSCSLSGGDFVVVVIGAVSAVVAIASLIVLVVQALARD